MHCHTAPLAAKLSGLQVGQVVEVIYTCRTRWVVLGDDLSLSLSLSTKALIRNAIRLLFVLLVDGVYGLVHTVFKELGVVLSIQLEALD